MCLPVTSWPENLHCSLRWAACQGTPKIDPSIAICLDIWAKPEGSQPSTCEVPSPRSSPGGGPPAEHPGLSWGPSALLAYPKWMGFCLLPAQGIIQTSGVRGHRQEPGVTSTLLLLESLPPKSLGTHSVLTFDLYGALCGVLPRGCEHVKLVNGNQPHLAGVRCPASCHSCHLG